MREFEDIGYWIDLLNRYSNKYTSFSDTDVVGAFNNVGMLRLTIKQNWMSFDIFSNLALEAPMLRTYHEPTQIAHFTSALANYSNMSNRKSYRLIWHRDDSTGTKIIYPYSEITVVNEAAVEEFLTLFMVCGTEPAA